MSKNSKDGSKGKIPKENITRKATPTTRRLTPSEHVANFDTVLFHGNCADGIAASWNFWREDTDNRLVYGKCLRDQAPPDVTDQRVVILDFCYSLEETIEMAKQAESIVIIDHHETSKNLIGKVPDNVKMLIDTSRSGCQLTWDYMYGTDTPWFLEVIAAHDLWKWDVPEHKLLSDILYRKGYYSWEKLESLYEKTMDLGEDMTIDSIIALGKQQTKRNIEGTDPETEFIQKQVKAAHHSSFLTEYTSPSGKKYTARIVNCDRKIRSEVGNSLCADEAVMFSVVWQHDFLTNQWWCACRTRPDSGVDLSILASEHGGGGHKQAASFVIYGDKGESLHTYFRLIQVPPHRTMDAIKYNINFPKSIPQEFSPKENKK